MQSEGQLSQHEQAGQGVDSLLCFLISSKHIIRADFVQGTGPGLWETQEVSAQGGRADTQPFFPLSVA